MNYNMKSINEYIMESSSSTIVNRIKKEFEKEFGKTVTIGSGKANYRQLYDVYIYDDKLETLQKVNEILKKHIPIWRGFTDEEMKDKIKEKEEFFKKHKDDTWVTLDRYPIEFFRFTSRDLQKIK